MNPELQLEFLKITLTIITFFCSAMVLVILWKKKDELQSFIWPHMWASVTMLELDNNVRIWLQKKNDSLTFRFNKGIYYMYEPGTKELEVEKKDEQGNLVKALTRVPIRQPSIYRSGRLAQFFYVEGNENPLDFRNNTITGNPQINEEMLKVESSRMITSAGGFGQELMQKYGFFLILGIGLLVLVMIMLMVQSGQKAKAVEQIVPLVVMLKVRK